MEICRRCKLLFSNQKEVFFHLTLCNSFYVILPKMTKLTGQYPKRLWSQRFLKVI